MLYSLYDSFSLFRKGNGRNLIPIFKHYTAWQFTSNSFYDEVILLKNFNCFLYFMYMFLGRVLKP